MAIREIETDITEKKKVSLGGRRPNAGRKPIEDKPLSSVIIARTSQDLKDRFHALGGAKWLREVLHTNIAVSQNTPTISVQPTDSHPLACTTQNGGVEGDTIDFNHLLAPDAQHTVVMYMPNDAMLDTGINKNDLLVIDRSLTPASGNIVAVRVRHEMLVMRYLSKASKPFLRPENAKGQFRNIYPRDDAPWEIFGVVRGVIKKFL